MKWVWVLAFLIAVPGHVSAREDLTVLYTSNTLGELGACGCSVEALGGLDRRASVLSDERSSGRPVVLLDVGDTFFISSKLPDHLQSDANESAERMTRAYTLMNYDAIFPGEVDRAWVKAKPNELPWMERSRLIERGGWKVALIGWAEPSLGTNAPTGVKLQDEVDRWRKQSDLVLLLAHASSEGLEKVLRNVRGIDFAIRGHTGRLLREPEWIGNTPTVEADNRGQYVGRLRFHIEKGKISRQNQATRLALEERSRFLRAEPTADRTSTLVQVEKNLRALGKLPRNWYAHDVIRLDDSIRPDATVREMLGLSK